VNLAGNQTVTIKKTPGETAGIKDLLTKVTVHWGERSQHRKQTFNFSNLQAKTKCFSPFLANLSPLFRRELLSCI
jgi:hypothetical protein